MNIQTDIVTGIILLILLVSTMRRINWRSHAGRPFLTLIFLNLILIIAPNIVHLFDGTTTLVGTMILYLSVGFYYAIIPVFILYGFFYLMMTIQTDFDQKSWLMRLPYVLVFLNFILVLASFFFNLYFAFDDENRYLIGNHYYLIVVISLLLVAFTIFCLWYFRKGTRQRDYLVLLLFLGLPIAATIFYLIVPTTQVIWNSTALSLLMAYVYIQEQVISTDALTGVYNRSEYERTIKALRNNQRKLSGLTGILVDIDYFKEINDEHGHHVGDDVLIEVSRILKNAVKKYGFVYRVGGDEFLGIMLGNPGTDIDIVLEKIGLEIEAINEKKKYPFKVSTSIGHAVYHAEDYVDLDTFFIEIDRRMYADKKR